MGNGIRLAENEKKVEIINDFEDRSKRIIESAFIETEYSKFAQHSFYTVNQLDFRKDTFNP